MPFTLPSMSEMRDYIVALGRALFPGQNWSSRRTYHGKDATFVSGVATELHLHVQSAQTDLHPLTAPEGKPINDWTRAVGIVRKGATGARKAQAGRVRGAAAATVTSGTQLRQPETGLLFKVANATTVTIPGVFGVDPDSFFDADIEAVDTGSQTRLESGATLVFLSAPPGIQNIVTLVRDLDEGGFDEEQFGSLRQRFLATFAEARSGGSSAEFARWTVLALPEIVKGYSFPNRAGRGTIDVAGFYAGSGATRALDSNDRAAVVQYIKTSTNAPFQVSAPGGGLRCIETIPDPQRVEITVETTGVAAYAFDFSDSNYTVDSYDPVTRELVWNTTLPGALRAGHRLVFDGVLAGSGVDAQDGTEYKIESISGADSVILEKSPPVAPANGDKIYSGGPLTTPLRAAIVAHLNGEIVYAGQGRMPIPESAAASSSNPTGPSVIGLGVLAAGIGPANPDGRYGDWTGGILRNTLATIATYKAGVRNITTISPASDYFPLDDPYPNNAQIHYVTPLVVLIRSA
jgi:uncharacterized phage protein gp47/JayE